MIRSLCPQSDQLGKCEKRTTATPKPRAGQSPRPFTLGTHRDGVERPYQECCGGGARSKWRSLGEGGENVAAPREGSLAVPSVEQNLPWNTQLGSYAGGLLDTEGSIWFSNPKGLERLSYSPLVKQELTGEGFYFALAADE